MKAAVASSRAVLAAPWLRARTASLLDGLVMFWIFCGGMVITEPSPYELAFLLVLGVSAFAGFNLHRSMRQTLHSVSGSVPFQRLHWKMI